MKSNKQLLLTYAGFAFQLLVVLAITVWIGLKLDEWLHFKIPIFVCFFPLIAIIATIYKVIKDTQEK